MGIEREPLNKLTLTPLPDGPFEYDNPLYPESGKILYSGGEEITCGRRAKLCRCGASKRMPFCDGTHEEIGFSGKRESDRSNDRRRDYVGERITIHDNRCACSHARHCINELPSVFRMGDRPWIDPDGADPERIIEVIEKCPSGALSYSVDGVEHRDLDREPAINITRDGPYCLVGGIEVVGEEPRADKVSREHCTCCRCGTSENKPFCDGSHWQVGFEDYKD
jgi:CDGSH-type Zn-finger protein